MKTTIKSLILLAASSLVLTGCIEETFPESSDATREQLSTSPAALEGLVNGMPAQMTQTYLVYGEQNHETDIAYPTLAIIQTELLGDMYPGGSNSGYDWYRRYNTFDTGCGETTAQTYVPWRTLYMFIKSANDVISAVDTESEDTAPDALRYAGYAYANRALSYYHLMTFYEPVANIYTDCSKVLGLTVPIVTDETPYEQIQSNPRATHDDMVEFILSDLKKAETLLEGAPENKLFASQACVYGLMARTYMWDKDYANAAVYARKAIDAFKGSPVTAAQWNDLTTGFNTANQGWMWKVSYNAENMGNIGNFTGWMSGEADWGYSSLTCPMIDRSLYDAIPYADFRKYSFLDPDRSKYDYKTPRSQEWLDACPNYLSLKFRCVAGDYETYTVGGVCDVPVMRIEEMYLIEAEALGASSGVDAGVAKLNEFMTKYRYASYNFSASSLEELQKEVLTQMRIEFWGEGEAFPVAKRLQLGVVQNYDGTNAPADNFKINCKGIKPIWNLVIPVAEIEGNPALDGYNNPDPTGTVVGPTPIGQYAAAK